MKYQNRTTNPEAYAYETEETALVPSLSYDLLMPAERRDFSPKALQTLSSEHDYTMAVERSRAELAYNAINLTAQLSHVEASLTEHCPTAGPRLKAIVDSFAYSEAVKIARY